MDPNRSIYWAAAANNIQLVNYLRKRGAHIDEVLVGAANGGHLDLVKSAIDQGTIPNSFNRAIYAAAKHNHTEIVTYLLTQGASINIALYGAAAGGHISLVRELINAGANDIYYSIMRAVEHNQIAMVNYLLDQPTGDPINIMSAALSAAARQNNVELLASLINRGVNPDLLSAALQDAIIENRVEAVRYLVEHGATNLDRALTIAAVSNNIDLVQYLLNHGATDLNGALVSAAASGKLPMVQYLIAHGANNIRGAIYIANQVHNPQIVAYLESLLEHP
jgi:ankyrin repeat protein